MVLAAAVFLCIYSVGNYKGNTAANENRVGFNNSFSGRKNVPQDRAVQRSRGQGQEAYSGQPGPGFNRGTLRGNTDTGIRYNKSIIVYSIAFLAVFIAAYFLLAYKNVKISAANEKFIMFTLLCLGLILRIFIAAIIEGHPFDINTFKNWATAAANNLSQVYSSSRSSDYPPLYMYVLFVIGKIAGINGMNPYYTILLKLPSIAADILTSLLIYRLAKKYLSSEISMILSVFYIFNPAVFVNSAIWGQVDSFFTLIVVYSLVMLSEKKVMLSSVLFTAAVLMKPQGIIFLPALFFELVRMKDFKSFLKSAAAAIITAVIVILPFSLNKGFLWIFKLFSNTVGEYPYASVNAFNFFSFIGKNYTKDTDVLLIFSYHSWGMIFIVLVTLFTWFFYIKADNRNYAAAAALIQIAGVFTFSASMHERYLFPAVALSILTFIYLRDKRLLLLPLGFSCTVFINTYYVLYETVRGINSVSYTPVLIFTSLLNIILFIYLIKVLIDIVIKKRHTNSAAVLLDL